MFPKEFLSRMEGLIGPEGLEAFLEAAKRPRAVALRLNTLKKLPTVTGGEPVPWSPNSYYYDPNARPGLSPYHDAGAYYLQEASAMAPAGLLDVRPGMTVLDLCAAPGGKSTQLAALLDGQGLLISNEIEPKRARVLGQNLERMGCANALVLNEHPKRLEERFPGYFDRILVDAPCSGEGMFRKEAAAVADWSVETVLMCARRQDEILKSAAVMLRPGGRLVYSTCTFAPEENEGTVSRFLHTHPDFHVVKVEAPWFAPGRPDWIDDPAPGLEKTFRLWPHKLKGEGHYIAVLEKLGDEVLLAGESPRPMAENTWARSNGGNPRRRERGIAPTVPKELEEFLTALDITLPEGALLPFGKSLWLTPPAMPELRGLKVIRPGLELGQLLKNRFEPAHALALWLKTAASKANFSGDSPEIAAYLSGQTIPGPQTGWTLITVDGLSLGWAKGSGGVLKNHYPKGLRR